MPRISVSHGFPRNLGETHADMMSASEGGRKEKNGDKIQAHKVVDRASEPNTFRFNASTTEYSSPKPHSLTINSQNRPINRR